MGAVNLRGAVLPVFTTCAATSGFRRKPPDVSDHFVVTRGTPPCRVARRPVLELRSCGGAYRPGAALAIEKRAGVGRCAHPGRHVVHLRPLGVAFGGRAARTRSRARRTERRASREQGRKLDGGRSARRGLRLRAHRLCVRAASQLRAAPRPAPDRRRRASGARSSAWCGGSSRIPRAGSACSTRSRRRDASFASRSTSSSCGRKCCRRIVAERGPNPSPPSLERGLRVRRGILLAHDPAASTRVVVASQPARDGHLARGALSRATLSIAPGLCGGWTCPGSRPYLVNDSGRFRVCDEIRQSVRFEKLNLAEALFPSPTNGTTTVDLIFCRNVHLSER